MRGMSVKASVEYLTEVGICMQGRHLVQWDRWENKPRAFCCHLESWQPVSHWAAFHLQSDECWTEFSRLSQGINSAINYWVFSMQAPHFWPIIVISYCWFLGQSSSQPSQTRNRVSLDMAWAKHTDVITRSVSMWFYVPWNAFMSPFHHFTSHCTAKSASDI